jgi:hypothetical protein
MMSSVRRGFQSCGFEAGTRIAACNDIDEANIAEVWPDYVGEREVMPLPAAVELL